MASTLEITPNNSSSSFFIPSDHCEDIREQMSRVDLIVYKITN